jgi:hypothetical protein
MNHGLVKTSTQKETRDQLLQVDKSMADTITRILDIDDRNKEIMANWRATKEYKELKAMAKEKRELIVVQHEKNGARKLLFAMFKKFGIQTPETSLTKLAKKNEDARALIPA